MVYSHHIASRTLWVISSRAGRERYPVLRVSLRAMDLLHQSLGIPDTNIPGATFTVPQAEEILRYANTELRRARSEGDRVSATEWLELRNAIEENRALAKGGPMVAIAEPQAEREELNHAIQVLATGDFYAHHLGPEGGRKFLESRAGAKADKEILRTYPAANEAQRVMEIGVRLMEPGGFRELNLTAEEAIDLRALYIDGLVQRHGPERVAKIIRRIIDAGKREASARDYGTQTTNGARPGIGRNKPPRTATTSRDGRRGGNPQVSRVPKRAA